MKQDKIETAWSGAEKCETCGIRHLALFADLEHEDFVHIHNPIHEVVFKHGEALYHLESAAEHVYTVRSGLVKLVQYLPDGTPRIVRILRPGDLAGIEITTGGNYQHDAIALTPVETCQIPMTVINTLSEETPRLHRQLLERWKNALITADSWLTQLSTGTARNRVINLLLWLDASTTQADGSFTLPVREDIGAMVALTTETVSRIVAELRRSDIVSMLPGQRARIDRDELALLIEEE
ncbi:hypothetical protein BOW28_08900 [Solemya velum gill symbiont]|uniref:Crp/Fnr family transcriptional regulator n=1 Tax=Solemya velum gill symbiont TaxID=2340 RepID=UPI000997F196|nr:Crp/Fnr family transcriptional regulator [Solemya velum gill symbiont]OOZ16802.1 hypothetical protein BOW28_08900 [Solemya velum gill symbiont]OOZ26237.1 hypothetical protein BOW32_09170 [Solemya velum gill symbiont]